MHPSRRSCTEDASVKPTSQTGHGYPDMATRLAETDPPPGECRKRVRFTGPAGITPCSALFRGLAGLAGVVRVVKASEGQVGLAEVVTDAQQRFTGD